MTILDAGWACRCGRALTSENEQVGSSCRGCVTEWVRDNHEAADEAPVAYFRSGHPTFCEACHQETDGLDLCARCDGSTRDFGRPGW